MVGGYLFEYVGGTGTTGFNLSSMFVAVIGAIVVLVVYHLIRPACSKLMSDTITPN